ncbi:hypothetical protein OBBRIDRAFT_616728 [Obba rivulosa]|uniref:Uncharacterized protein n=1 Tax=Obba rivulosa TaxID=1052685 RepID=A0A8E2DTC7_9APHY|nr:hypothetical protein OBBRIDRAFT_616728 [Obba rivulosa]
MCVTMATWHLVSSSLDVGRDAPDSSCSPCYLWGLPSGYPSEMWAQHPASQRHSKNRDPLPIPVDEDVRRLFHVCQKGQRYAEFLQDALASATPDGPIEAFVQELVSTCLRSQAFIASQIPWATVQAEKSRFVIYQTVIPKTKEEELLDTLLSTLGVLEDALKAYGELEKLAVECLEERHRQVEPPIQPQTQPMPSRNHDISNSAVDVLATPTPLYVVPPLDMETDLARSFGPPPPYESI